MPTALDYTTYGNALIDAMNAILEPLQVQVSQLEADDNTQGGAIVTLRDRVTADEATLAAHTTEIASHEGQLETIGPAVTALQTRVQSDEATLAAHTTEIASHEGQLETIGPAVTALRDRVTADEATLAAHTTELASQQGQLDTLGPLVQAHGIEITSAQAQLDSLGPTVVTLRDTTVAGLSANVSNLVDLTSTLSTRADSAEADLGALQDGALQLACGVAAADPTNDCEAISPAELAASLFDVLLFGPLLDRPGDAPKLFGISTAGGNPNALPAGGIGEVVTTADGGAALRVQTSGTVATRQMFAVEPGRTYRLRAVVQRRVDTPDPAGDAIQIAVAWYDGNKVALAPSATVVEALPLTVAAGRTVVSALFSSAGLPSATTIPAGACNARPLIDFFGETHVTDAQVLSWVDVTDQNVLTPNVDALASQVAAIQSQNLPARVTTLESEVTAPTSLRFATVAAAETAHVPNTVLTLTTAGYSAPGIGAARYVRVTQAAAIGFATADGALWGLAEPRVTAEMCGALGNGTADDAAAFAALPAGWTVHADRGTYRLGSAVTTGATLILSADATLTGPGSLGGDVRRPDLLYAGHRPSLGDVKQRIETGEPVTIDCWGDSVTYGLDTSATGVGIAPNTRSPYPYPETLGTSLGQAFPGLVTVENKGVASNTASDLLARVIADTATPDLALLMCGIDDAAARVPMTQHRASYHQIVELLLGRGAVVVVMLPTPIADPVENRIVQAYAAAQRRIANDYGLTLIDTGQQLDGVTGQAKWTDGVNLAPAAFNELGWHLAAILLSTGGDGGSRRGRVGLTIYPEDGSVISAAPQPLAGSTTGNALAVPPGTSQLALFCEDEVSPVLVGLDPGDGDARSLEVVYARDASGPQHATMSFPGASAPGRATVRGAPLARGYRVLTLYNPGAIPFYLDTVTFYPRPLPTLSAGV